MNDLWKFDGTMWTWVSGSSTAGATGVYGTQGTADSANVPGARYYATGCVDSAGNLWLFGGFGKGASGTGSLNDLWKFDGSQWTWVSGSTTPAATGVYGTKGTAAATNVPGARNHCSAWSDSSGNLWLFGGEDSDKSNDLWKFDGSQWTWVSGSNTAGATGVYGTKGIAAGTNVPGARCGSVGWIDSAGHSWLFGGIGYDSTQPYCTLNDLWKFDGSQWTWVSGSNTKGATGSYGTQGTAGSGNVPGARYYATGWIDSAANLWLFGGYGFDSAAASGALNDLWKCSTK